MIKKLMFIIIFPALLNAEQDFKLNYEFFLDTYYAQQIPDNSQRIRPYTTQAVYSEEPNINLVYLQGSLESDSWHGKVVLQEGNSVKMNYAAEPDYGVRYFQEAFIGHKLTDDLWLDAGVFLSHIGPESWISNDNWTYTRALISEFSPYYQSGLRLTYQSSEDLGLQLHLLRGWQNISDDRDLALGTQVNWKANPKLTFTHNSFIGNENGNRIFNDFILKYEALEKARLFLASDIGYQEMEYSDATWYGLALVGQYDLSNNTKIALRLEHFEDSEGVVAASSTGDAFNADGVSLNLDYQIYKNLLWRNEYRLLNAHDEIFNYGESLSKRSQSFVTALTFEFN